MWLRIVPFVLLIVLTHSEPSVIDSLMIQLPSLPEADESFYPDQLRPPPHVSRPLVLGPSGRRTHNSSTTMPTTSTTSTTTTTTTTTTTQAPKPLNPLQRSTPKESQDVLSERLRQNPTCPGISCYTMALPNGSITFDCTEKLPSGLPIMNLIDCNYWQPPTTSLIPITAKYFNSGPQSIAKTTNHAVTLRIVLKPRTDNPNLRISADVMTPGALTRLIEAVKQHVKPYSTTPIKLSLIMVRIKRLTFEDLAGIFEVANVSGLILWNPEEMEETSFLRNAANVSTLSETYVRLTFYCETENDMPAFGRLWLPWLRWQVKFLQCRGHYSCYRWPREERLCCNHDRCPEVPGYVLTHADKLINRNPAASSVHQQQVLDFYSCETESDLTSPLVDLRRRHNCWSIPGYEFIDTTSTWATDPITSTTTTTTTEIVSTTTEKPLPITTPTMAFFDDDDDDDDDDETTKSEGFTSTTTPLILLEAGTESQSRLRSLVIGIVALLILNVVTLSCFVVLCCWAYKKINNRRTPSETTASFVASSGFEKQDGSSSEMAPTPLFARNGFHHSFEQTPVMGSRDALLPANFTPASVRAFSANGLPPSGQKSMRILRSSNSSLRGGHPHTIVFEGDPNLPITPTRVTRQPHPVRL